MHVDNVDPIVLACCALHNFLKIKSSTYLTENCIDTEDTNNLTFRQGDWHKINSLIPLEQCTIRERNEEGNNVRNMFTNYFNGQERVSFQENMMRVITQ